MATTLVAVIVLWCVFVATVRVTGTDASPLLIGLVGVTPLAMIPIWVALPLVLYRRQIAWIAAVAVLCTAQVTWASDEWRIPGLTDRPVEPVAGEGVVLSTGNLLVDNPTPERFMAAILESKPDVILLQELTPEAWRSISEAADYPYQVMDPQDTGLGSAILSRLPMRNPSVIDRHITRWTTADVQWPNGEWVTIVNVHTTSPLDSTSIDRWESELDLLAQWVDGTDGPLILAGDFNATVHHDEFQALLDGGMVDSHQEAGSGLGRTWSLRGVPLLGLDHVLVSDGLAVSRAWSDKGPGSDHRITSASLTR